MGAKAFAAEGTGVIVVDLQADFTEAKSGALAVPGTDAPYIDAVEKATRELAQQGLPIYFTQDWHPPEHVSFYTNHPGTEPLQMIKILGRSQVMWPPHCIQNSAGAEILVTAAGSTQTVRKGLDPDFDSYSGFADDGGRRTDLDRLLRRDGINKLIVYGLATDYCVKATVLDAVDAGYRVRLFVDLCRGVSPDTTKRALEEMKAQGVTVGRFHGDE
ncbi:MAG: bifunctional nicotinamidase/pyrazinamidase [Desulfobacterales bacterium]|nr:MAG: bifunctional nicotinamidase/pyrazinamidase [Desulfobacterales bacterium]